MMHKISRKVLFLSLLLLIFIVISVAITASNTNNHLSPNRPMGTVLLVGSYDGFNSNFNSIQAAINAASPGDYILLAPGYYGGNPSQSNQVLINKPDLHLVGLNETSVIIGAGPLTSNTKSKACYQGLPQSQQLQNQNGIVIKSTGDSIDNLTVCNFSGKNSIQSGAQIEISNTGQTSTTLETTISHVNLTAGNILVQSQQQSLPSVNYGIETQGNVNLKIKNSSFSNFAASGIYIGNCSNCRLSTDNLQFINSFSGIILNNVSGDLTIDNSTFLNNFNGLDAFNVNNKPDKGGFCKSNVVSKVHINTSPCTQIKDNLFGDSQHYTGSSVTNYNQNPNQNLYDDFNLTGQFPNLPYGVGISILGSNGFSIGGNSFNLNNMWATVITDIFIPQSSNICEHSITIANADCIVRSNYINVSNNRATSSQNLFLNIAPFEDLGIGLSGNHVCFKHNYFNGRGINQQCDVSNVNLFSNAGLILNCISNYDCSSSSLNITQAKLKLFGTTLGQNITGLDNVNIPQVVNSKFVQTTNNPDIVTGSNDTNICNNIPINRWC